MPVAHAGHFAKHQDPEPVVDRDIPEGNLILAAELVHARDQGLHVLIRDALEAELRDEEELDEDRQRLAPVLLPVVHLVRGDLGLVHLVDQVHDVLHRHGLGPRGFAFLKRSEQLAGASVPRLVRCPVLDIPGQSGTTVS